MIGWTTTGSQAEAHAVARGLIEAELAACAQAHGPVHSVYKWEGQLQEDEEWRVTVKFLAGNQGKVASWLREHHPYDTFQWYAIRADSVDLPYLEWARKMAPLTEFPR